MKVGNLRILIFCFLFVACSSQTPTLAPEPTHTLTATSIPPTVTPTVTRTPIPTPNPWHSYQMKNTVYVGGISKLWIPVPRTWDEIGQRNIEIISIEPTPDELYEDNYGNLIAFWNVGYANSKAYSVTFKIELAPIKTHNVDLNNVGEYDKSSWEYQRFTQPSTNIQSNNDTVTQLARQIVGEETNPYIQAKLIQKWVSTKITHGGTADDVLSVINSKMSRDCYGWSITFIGLLRSIGVPARLVGGYHNYRDGYFSTGLYEWSNEPFGIHVWAEFFVPNYGWLQIEPQRRDVFGINEERIVLFRGEDIELKPGYPPLEHFHMPHVGYPPQQYGDNLSLEVNPLP